MIENNLHVIQKKIEIAAQRNGRTSEDVKIVAVSKLQSVEKISEAVASGLIDFGENYVQEALRKIEALGELSWHFIGHIQSKKAKQLVDKFEWIHSVDRLSLIEELEKRSEKPVKILLQVNVAGEDSKSGFSPLELSKILDEIQALKLKKIQIKGLMTMPPLENDPQSNRVHFQKLCELSVTLKSKLSAPHSLDELSMGTSHDYEIAIEEGATMVRLGTCLMGAREV